MNISPGKQPLVGTLDLALGFNLPSSFVISLKAASIYSLTPTRHHILRAASDSASNTAEPFLASVLRLVPKACGRIQVGVKSWLLQQSVAYYLGMQLLITDVIILLWFHGTIQLQFLGTPLVEDTNHLSLDDTAIGSVMIRARSRDYARQSHIA